MGKQKVNEAEGGGCGVESTRERCIKWKVEDVEKEKEEEDEGKERKRRSHRVSDKIQRARSDSSVISFFFFLPLCLSLSLSLRFCRSSRLRAPPASLAAFALVPSPRPLAGAHFFPTRSSGIPPLLTAACFSRPRTDTNLLLGDVPLRSFFDSTINLSEEGIPSCRKLRWSSLLG